MPILWSVEHETGATTNRFMAACERFVDWALRGPRQHEADLRWDLGRVSSVKPSERSVNR